MAKQMTHHHQPKQNPYTPSQNPRRYLPIYQTTLKDPSPPRPRIKFSRSQAMIVCKELMTQIKTMTMIGRYISKKMGKYLAISLVIAPAPFPPPRMCHTGARTYERMRNALDGQNQGTVCMNWVVRMRHVR